MSKIATMVGPLGVNFYVNGNIYAPDVNGLISGYTNPAGASVAGIADTDINELLAGGAWFGGRKMRNISISAPAAASATAVVNAQALANGAITVAAQPDVPRQLQGVVTPGTLAITAGTITVAYVDVNGKARSDVLAAAAAISTATTQALSHGVATVTSVTAAGITGGATPTFSLGTTASIAIPIDDRPDGLQGTGLNVFKAMKDTTNDTLPTLGVAAADAGVITPNTAPNATHTYSFGYSFVA